MRGNPPTVAGAKVVYGLRSDGAELDYWDGLDVYDTRSGTWTTGKLQSGRETPEVAVVGSQVLFVGAQLGCQGCGPNKGDPLVDIFDASLA